MALAEILAENKATVLKRWTDLIRETYPAQTAKFLKSQTDRFANPVGHSIVAGADSIFEALLDRSDQQSFSDGLDTILQVRAVQEFSASQAVAFVFPLKDVVREQWHTLKADQRDLSELLEFESAIDKLALVAFDVYMERRERIYSLRANELRNRTGWMLNRIYGDPEVNDSEGGEQ